jgi:peptide/nickel transport system permease protein
MAVRIIPGNECVRILQTNEYEQSQCDKVRHLLGLDRPAPVQYVHWMGSVLHGDLGTSFITNRGAFDTIKSRMAPTFELAVLASLVALGLGVTLGVVAAAFQDSVIDDAAKIFSMTWLSIPSFWFATVLIVFGAKWFGYSPPVGYTSLFQNPTRNLEQIFWPMLVLSLEVAATLTRVTRSSMLEILRSDFIRTAHSKGLSQKSVLVGHGLKNALLPVVTLFGLQFTYLLGGTVILESIYNIPGLGTLLISSVNSRDYVQIQAIAIFFASLVVILALLVDISYAWLDPRVRFS